MKRAHMGHVNCLGFRQFKGLLTAIVTYNSGDFIYDMIIYKNDNGNRIAIPVIGHKSRQEIIDIIIDASKSSDVFVYMPMYKIMSKNENLESLFIEHDMEAITSNDR